VFLRKIVDDWAYYIVLVTVHAVRTQPTTTKLLSEFPQISIDIEVVTVLMGSFAYVPG